MKVAWFSAGVSSFVAALFSKPDKIIYIDIDDQHPDSMRFVEDCERVLGHEIEILKSPYGSVENAILAAGFIRRARSACKCTDYLKKRVRKEWELQQAEPLTYVWGMDCAERGRADAIIETMTNMEHEFPLIDLGLEKQEAHAICEDLGVKRPLMYDLGYNNNNCIGCVKGGMGYWNKIRVDFPDVFESRAKLERRVNSRCLKDCFLDELEPGRGRMSEEILPECGIFCEIALQNGDIP
jgi:hypothetical protein